jgi:drug/metabolite transporter (DMT)-like permease
MDPFALNAIRFTVSAATMGAIVGWRRPDGAEGLWTLVRRHAGRVVVLGLIGHLFYQLFFVLGIARTTAGTAALIMASAPAWTALIGHARGYERLQPGPASGLALSLAGAALIVLAGEGRISFDSSALVGNLLIWGASVMWGTYTALAVPTTRLIPPLELSLAGLLVSLPILVGIGLPSLFAVTWADVPSTVWASIAYSGALSTGLATVIWTVSVRYVGANYTALFGNLVPLIALTTGAVFLDENITWAQVLGGTLSIGGLVLMRFSRTRPSPSNVDTDAR